MLKLKLLLIQYRLICPLTIPISVGLWIIAGAPGYGTPDFTFFVVVFFWLRTLAQGIIWYLIRLLNGKSFYFYHLAGLTESALMIGCYVLEVSVFGLWLFVFYLIF